MPADPKTTRRDERFTMLEPKGPNNLTEAQKAYPVVEGRHLERFTMLEPKGPTHLTPERTGWPIVELADPIPPDSLVADDLALLKGLINRVGAARLHQLIERLTADTQP